MQALVHPIETTDGAERSLSYRAFKGQKHFIEVRKIQEIYETLGKDPNGPFLDRFNRCSTFAWFVRHKKTGNVFVRSSACRIRWCPLCGETRQQFLTKQTKKWLDCQKHPKLLTLTVKHSDKDVTEQIDHLYRSFQKLRKRKLFKRKVRGGIWFFQIKRSKDGNQWHPHLHVMLAGKYLERKALSALWFTVTGDSEVIDIRAVKDKERSAKHVARYAVKPADVTELSLDNSVSVVKALKGRRLVGTFGTAKELSLRPQKNEDVADYENIGSWNFVIHMQGSNERADAILNAFFGKTPLTNGNSLNEIEQQITRLKSEETRGPPNYDETFYIEEL